MKRILILFKLHKVQLLAYITNYQYNNIDNFQFDNYHCGFIFTYTIFRLPAKMLKYHFQNIEIPG